MSGPGSVTVWLDQLKAGANRDEAVAELWERYFSRLVNQARLHLRGRRTMKDEEDAALSAFDGLVRGVEAGKFPRLDDRGDLWRVLLMMTANKARNAVRDENREKRRGGQVAHAIAAADSDPAGVVVPSGDPDPAEVVALAESVGQMLAALGDAELRLVAEMALAGHSNAEIADAIKKVVPTVERKRMRIREIWAAMGYG